MRTRSLIGVGLMTWPWILDRLEASGVFNQISTVSSTVDALSAEERERIGYVAVPSFVKAKKPNYDIINTCL